MKVSTTLENIEYTLQQRNKQEEQQQTKQEIKKDYILYITDFISEEIESYFLNNKKEAKTIYNYLLLENKYINKIIKELKKEQQQRTSTKAIIRGDNNNWREEKEIIYLWDDYNLEEDTKIIFYKKLKEIFKKYQELENIENEIIENKLINDLNYVYNKYGYKASHKAYYIDETPETIANFYNKATQKQKNYIIKNYYKILKTIDSQYKQLNKEKEMIYNKKNIIERNKGKIILGGAVYGFISGLIKASKS